MRIEDCLLPIIGITNRDCDCPEDEKPEDATDSQSGLFVDDIFEGIALFKIGSSLKCGDKIWDVLVAARSKAVESFITRLSEGIDQLHRETVTPFHGTIGDPSQVVKKVATSKQFAVIELKAGHKAPAGMVNRLRGVNLFIDTPGVYNVKILENGVEKEDFDVTVTSGTQPTYHKLTTPYIMEFLSSEGEQKVYHITYDLQGAKPYDTRFHCNCGSPPNWTKYIRYGSTLNDTADLNVQKNNRKMFGLSLHVGISCGLQWMCSTWNFQLSPWARTMAKCLQLMSILNCTKYLLNSGEINRISLLEGEELAALADQLENQIDGRLNYLSTHLPAEAKNCWTCKSRIWKGEISV